MRRSSRWGERDLRSAADTRPLSKEDTRNDRNDYPAIVRTMAAVEREMTPAGARPHRATNTLFLGALDVAAADRAALEAFGFDTNCNFVVATFAGDANLPMTCDVFVNDGIGDSAVLRNGRLWKRSARDAAVLLFAGIEVTIGLDATGSPPVRMSGGRHELDHRLAAAAVRSRAARTPAGIPVLAPIGSRTVILEARAVADMLVAAA